LELWLNPRRLMHFPHAHGEMNITPFFGQDKMTAFDVIDLPTSSF